jgi:hypothetical protein
MIRSSRNLSELRLWSIGLPNASQRKRIFNALIETNGLLVILVASSVFIPGIASAQTPPARTQSNSKVAVPVTMTECEGTNNCATWTFLGGQGNGQWPSGEMANLSVEHFDADTVVIRRADSTGPSAGLTAVYNGTRHGDRIGGEFTSSWPGHWNNMSGNWYATIGKAAQSPPTVMNFCTTPFKNCFTFTWNNGRYDAIAGNGQIATVTVESFTPESVVLRMTQPSGNWSVSTGKISSAGNSILNGDWLDRQGSTGHFAAAWGAALRDIPGAQYQVQPQQRVVAPVVCFPWFFSMVCQ